MLFATTNEPWNAVVGKMRKFYELILMCPIGNYANNYMIWREGILNKVGYDLQLDITALAKVTLYYSPAAILSAIDEVFTGYKM